MFERAISLGLLVYCITGPCAPIARCSVTVLEEMDTTEAQRNELAARATHIGEQAADLIRNPQSDVKRLPTPFFHDGAVYRVTRNMPSRPVVFTIGTAGRDFAVMLAMNPSGFFELASKAGLTLGSPQLRVQYAEVFLETTRDFRRRLQILKDASGIQLVPNATPEQKARYGALLEKYESIIEPPRVSPISTSEVILYALVGEDLQEIRLKIANDGKMTRSDTILEKDLPIGVAR